MGKIINKTIHNQVEQLLYIEPLATMYFQLMGSYGEEGGNILDETLALVNMVVRFVENDEMKEYEQRYDDLIKLDIRSSTDEELDEFITQALTFTEEVFNKTLEIYKRGDMLLWSPGKGTVLVNGK